MQHNQLLTRRAVVLSLLSAAVVGACGPVDAPASGLSVEASITAGLPYVRQRLLLRRGDSVQGVVASLAGEFRADLA